MEKSLVFGEKQIVSLPKHSRLACITGPVTSLGFGLLICEVGAIIAATSESCED